MSNANPVSGSESRRYTTDSRQRNGAPRRAAALLAALALVLGACSGRVEAPVASVLPSPSATPTPEPEPTCPLSGLEPRRRADLKRPAVAVKVNNVPAAYPLSGLEDAELIYEEVVEGGVTRFMAMYHCTDAELVGPMRSVRSFDVAIMTPITRILAASGGNDHVLAIIRRAGIFLVEEMPSMAHAVMRVPRPGVSREHTLYGVTAPMREIADPDGTESPPPDNMFKFGELEARGKRARSISLTFGRLTSATYEWNGKGWVRYQAGVKFLDGQGKPIVIDNIVIEEHTVNHSRSLFDVAGNPSPEIADEVGSGRAVLFRDGRAIRGKWVRKKVSSPVRYERRGKRLPLKPGRTWIALVPSPRGEVKGSFSYQARRGAR